MLNATAPGIIAMDRPVHELFEGQADRTPDAVAVVLDSRHLTYRALDERASQLAHRLVALGARRETRVAICMDRSIEMVVGLLGILKAGAAYVPIDPDYPSRRLEYMLADSRATIMVTQDHLRARFELENNIAILCLDPEWRSLESVSTTRLNIPSTTGDLAYVIYTSGSSGQPKGAMVSHGSVCNVLSWLQRTYALGPRDAIVQRIPFSFDGAVCDFYWALLVGGRLILLRPDAQRDPDYLAGVIAQHDATTIVLVPSMLSVLLERPDASARLRPLRRVFSGGETLTPDLVSRSFATLRPDVELVNLYGPTETTVFVTAWPCRVGDRYPTTPIGKPIANVTVHVLDDDMRPVHDDQAGELYVGGVCVARGYLDRPELTAERFVPDPFGPRGARLYRTGDVARRSADGVLEHLGRVDAQVKLRGFRIEPGEVEATLRRVPGIREAAVVLREDRPGTPRLVGYVVVDADRSHVESTIHASLREVLPDHMVPSAIVVLDRFPLTAHGKIDRGLLPPPPARCSPDVAHIAPRSPLEVVLASIVANACHADRVGMADGFFELGLDSLKLARVAQELSQMLNVEIPVGTFFTHPTLAGVITAIAPNATTRSNLEREAELVLSVANATDEEAEKLLSGEGR
jgi:amino acid adenylation domain-containing protein